jgi:hypothetical protein
LLDILIYAAIGAAFIGAALSVLRAAVLKFHAEWTPEIRQLVGETVFFILVSVGLGYLGLSSVEEAIRRVGEFATGLR